MTILLWLAAGFCVFTTGLHLVTCLIAAKRCRKPKHLMMPPLDAPSISLVRPVCGIETYGEETLRSAFLLDYPNYEIVFCVAKANDPVVPLVHQLMAEHPRVLSRLLIGDDRISANPKLNNMVKGWEGAAHDWIVVADSNVLMPVDYLQRLLAAWRPDTGLVCSPPAGTHPAGFWAHVECAFLNTYQARFQYVADSAGLGFAQGKNLFYLREILEKAGGMMALAMELAEDAASTKVVRAQGLRVRLVDAPFSQPLGYRAAADVWKRQVRWARLRRGTFAPLFACEIACGCLFPLILGGFAFKEFGMPALLFVPAFLALWLGAEALLARAAGWPLTIWSPLAWIMRDAMLPLIWIEGWRSGGFTWRGNVMTPATTGASK
jgi:ceramide glucosyltransferase